MAERVTEQQLYGLEVAAVAATPGPWLAKDGGVVQLTGARCPGGS